MKTRIKLVSFIPSPALTLFKESRLSTSSGKVVNTGKQGRKEERKTERNIEEKAPLQQKMLR